MRVPEVIFGHLIFLQRTPGPPVSGHHLILPEGVWLTLLADGPPLGHLGLSTIAAVRHDHTSQVDNDHTCQVDNSQQVCCSVRKENVTHNHYYSNLVFLLFCCVMLRWLMSACSKLQLVIERRYKLRVIIRKTIFVGSPQKIFKRIKF